MFLRQELPDTGNYDCLTAARGNSYHLVKGKGDEMTKKERVLAAFNLQKVDRVPMGFWYHFPKDADPEGEMLKQHLSFYRQSGNDFIKIMCDGFFNYPNPGIADIKQASDWKNLQPAGEAFPWIQKQIARAKAIKEAVGEECCVFYNVFNPMSLVRFETSDELLMEHLREDEEAMLHAFKAVAEDVKLLVKGLFETAHLDGIYYCVQNAEKFRFSTEEYKRIVSPSELDILEYANTFSDNNILHCCGWAGDRNNVEVWKDYPAKCVNWAVYVEKMNLSEGREFFGGKCVLGGFDNTKKGILYAGNKDLILRETRKLLEDAGTKGIIIGADCTLPGDIPLEHVHWVCEELAHIGEDTASVSYSRRF